MKSTSPYLIAETAYHHEGDAAFLEELIRGAGRSGAAAVKFHILLNKDQYLHRSSPLYSTIDRWMFSPSVWSETAALADSLGLDVIWLVDDFDSIDWIKSNDIPCAALEVHASGIIDMHLLKKTGSMGVPVILGIGGAAIEEIELAVAGTQQDRNTPVILMYGYQNYPTDLNTIQLSRISKYRSIFNTEIGYADHTDPLLDNEQSLACISAVGMGVNVIEKHLTTRPGEKRIDYQAAVSVEQFSALSRDLMLVSKILGDGTLQLSNAEIKYAELGPMRKTPFACRNLSEGEITDIDDFKFLRTDKPVDLSVRDFRRVIGKALKRTIAEDSIVDRTSLGISEEDKYMTFKDLTGGMEAEK